MGSSIGPVETAIFDRILLTNGAMATQEGEESSGSRMLRIVVLGSVGTDAAQ